MPELIFKNVSKSFRHHVVINAFTATVADGEFLVLLGPSGCGKSTLLRMVAGLTPINDGELLFNGALANTWTPKQRGVAFVFQSYALYPHMTVRANIAFPLVMDQFKKWQHLPIVSTITRWRMERSPEIAARTEKIARQLELTALLDRRPAALSGGQRQRVALARSLIRDPSLYLLDEPLSNLDAKLRTQMRAEISALHKKVGKTFVYVTHDQVEAMTMATRIIVMDKGVVQQVDTPEHLYAYPANTFVAKFVGSPAMNLITVSIDGQKLATSSLRSWLHDGPVPSAKQAILGIRPETLRIQPGPTGTLPVIVMVIERLGAETVLGCRLFSTDHENRPQDQAALIDPILGPSSDNVVDDVIPDDLIFVRMPGNPPFQLHERCYLDYSADAVSWFDSVTQQRITPDHALRGAINAAGDATTAVDIVMEKM